MAVTKKKKKVVRKPAASLTARSEMIKTPAPSDQDNTPAKGYSFGGFTPFFKPEASMIKGTKQFEKMSQDANVFGQEHMDMISRSATVLTKGMEDLYNDCMSMAKDATQKSQAAAKSVMSCKTLNEFTDVQTRLAQSSFDEFMTNMTRLSEKSVKLCTDVFAPINDQMGRSIKRTTDMAA